MARTTDQRHRLLIAEDDEEIRRQSARALSESGYEVIGEVPNGLEAMDAVRQYRPDLAVLDVWLPGSVDGPGIGRALDEVYGIPTIYIYGDDCSVDEFSRIPVSNSYRLLRKPFSDFELRTAVEVTLQRSESVPGPDPRESTGGPSEIHVIGELHVRDGSAPHWIGTRLVPSGMAAGSTEIGWPRPGPSRHGAGEPRYRRFFDHCPAGEFEATLSGELTDANSALASLLGYESEDPLLQRSLAELIPEEATRQQLLERLRRGHELDGEEVTLRGRDGFEVVGLIATSVVDMTGEQGQRVLGTVMDITERKRIESDLERLAFEDPLTGLANRRAVEEHATKYLALAERREAVVGLIYIDLTGFKEINDRFGHPVGDTVLVEVARRLETAARESDVVGRIGGDEFLVLLPDVEQLEDITTVAHRMEQQLMATAIELESDRTWIRAEMGVSIFPEDGSSLEDLIEAADRAMYRAKEERKNGDAGGPRIQVAGGTEDGGNGGPPDGRAAGRPG